MRNLGSHFPCRARFRDGDYKYTKYSGKTIPGTKKSPREAIFQSVGNTSAGQGSHSASAGRMTLSMTVYPSGVGCTPSLVYSLRIDPSPASIAP